MNGTINPSLKAYVESAILPRYDSFDKGHRRDHADYVISQALYLASFYDVDADMVYAAAAYHDTGLAAGRKFHHIESARIIREDLRLMEWFSSEQIGIIADAAEDHRASSDHEPRTIYGKIVAEADRQIVPETIIRRTIQYGIAHYPELDREGHWQRTLDHLHEKYAEGGYLKLWIPESPNAARLEETRAIIRDEARLRSYFDSMYAEETASSGKAKAYESVISVLEPLLSGEDDITARMADIAAVIHEKMGFWWTGFYRVAGEELLLGPFQGPVACLRIAKGRGVCGTAWAEDRTVVVPDVELFPGHIACSSESRSEIVVPVHDRGRVVAVLDIDSRNLACFDDTDAAFLQQIVEKFLYSRNKQSITMSKRLTLSESDKKLFGVCSGIARYFDVDPTLVRIIWIVATFLGGAGLVAYLICWAVMPKE